MQMVWVVWLLLLTAGADFGRATIHCGGYGVLSGAAQTNHCNSSRCSGSSSCSPEVGAAARTSLAKERGARSACCLRKLVECCWMEGATVVAAAAAVALQWITGRLGVGRRVGKSYWGLRRTSTQGTLKIVCLMTQEKRAMAKCGSGASWNLESRAGPLWPQIFTRGITTALQRHRLRDGDIGSNRCGSDWAPLLFFPAVRWQQRGRRPV